jgi:hypothetical protein
LTGRIGSWYHVDALTGPSPSFVEGVDDAPESTRLVSYRLPRSCKGTLDGDMAGEEKVMLLS